MQDTSIGRCNATQRMVVPNGYGLKPSRWSEATEYTSEEDKMYRTKNKISISKLLPFKFMLN
jgi:hypothetical protein